MPTPTLIKARALTPSPSPSPVAPPPPAARPWVEELEGRRMLASTAAFFYDVHNLVTDGGVVLADNTDTSLQNPIGLASGDGAEFLVANNRTATATFYDGDGNLVNDGGGDPTDENPHELAVPASGRSAAAALPTGAVFNRSKGFLVRSDTDAEPGEYFITSGDGVIAGYSAGVDPNNAVTVIDRNRAGAVYTGLTQAGFRSATYLYAADFRNGRIDVYNGKFKLTRFDGLGAGLFKDPGIPANYRPFGIQEADGMVFVTYALRDPATGLVMTGAHRGYVDEYTPGGRLYRRVASRGSLNAPWGIALAGDHFGRFSNNLLVANHGSGTITAIAFHGDHTTVRGNLLLPSRGNLTIDGLWALRFGNGSDGQPEESLFFTAGPNNGANGVFGAITVGQL